MTRDLDMWAFEGALREQIAKDIEARICNVVHNETAPEACAKMNDGLRIAAIIARQRSGV